MPIADLPVVGPAAVFAYRFGHAFPYVFRPFCHFVGWMITSTEHTNYTYDLEPTNKRYLAAFVADLTGAAFADSERWIAELDNDTELRAYLADRIRESTRRGRRVDADIRFGRRLGWYAVIRALRPRLVVETGVDQGLGACVITAALRRNAQEGAAGEYIGTEINPAKGFLLGGDYAEHGRIVYGDSIETLNALDRPIDLFINDSDHSDEYERREYDAIAGKLADRAVILGDNWGGEMLLEFALSTGRRFVSFREQPLAHWYPGEGIAAAAARPSS
jgi:predicted O-methyltransferase YrrM